jgi:hypothetical protein
VRRHPRPLRVASFERADAMLSCPIMAAAECRGGALVLKVKTLRRIPHETRQKRTTNGHK